MLDPNTIYLELESDFRELVKEVKIRPSDETILLYIYRDKVSDKVKPGFTSERQLENKKNKLKNKYSKEVEIIQTISEKHNEIEKSIFTLLNLKFSENVLSFYMSFGHNASSNVWLEFAGLDNELEEEITRELSKILADTGYELNTINWLNSNFELPTLPWLLRTLKVNQPIDLYCLLKLCSDSYPNVNEKWLNSKLDQLRKKKLIFRGKSGNYVLTTSGLSSVPSGTSRNSSDISRALVFGSKKWSN